MGADVGAAAGVGAGWRAGGGAGQTGRATGGAATATTGGGVGIYGDGCAFDDAPAATCAHADGADAEVPPAAATLLAISCAR